VKKRSIIRVAGICILASFIILGCSFFAKLLNPDLPFDIASDRMAGLSSRAATGSGEFPFTEFSKYEITVYYVHAWLYDAGIWAHSKHTLLNLPPGAGISVDLVNETLAEALGSAITIENPAGNAFYRLLIGIDPIRVVRGYAYNVGGTGDTYRTTPTGLVSDGREPEDMSIEGIGVGTADFSGNALDDDPPLNDNLYGASIQATGEFFKPLHDHLTIDADDLFQFRLPLDMGIVQEQEGWRGISLVMGVPFIESSTRYYKYYLKREGETYYTNMLRVLTDLNGNFIGGQIVGVAFQSSPLNVFGAFKVQTTEIDGLPTPGEYEALYTNHQDGTISFTSLHDVSGDVVVEGFALLDSPGEKGTAVFQMSGSHAGQEGAPPQMVAVEYIRVD
jgi:hypothetical protein